MTALTADRNTPRLQGDILVLDLAASIKVFAGSIVMRNAAGNGTKGATATGSVGVGVAVEQVDNSAGAAGDKTVQVRTGIFKFANSASGDLITKADINKPAYIVDDQTVAKTNGTNTRSIAGMIVGLDALGVWVRFDEALAAAYLT
ncbi:MAG: hypothetical protein K2Q10_00635 [Rhodospirillales bacterium]|nr:hypothetical protein [Rhodospirillales bacterium]